MRNALAVPVVLLGRVTGQGLQVFQVHPGGKGLALGGQQQHLGPAGGNFLQRGVELLHQRMAKGVALLRTVEGEYGEAVFIGERKRGRHGRKSLTARMALRQPGRKPRSVFLWRGVGM